MSLKITAGLGSVDDYLSFVEAGADELFCGYVPHEWMNRDGLAVPMNRREVLNVNVQIGSAAEMKILGKMVRACQVPVTIALNGLYYLPEQYPKLVDYVKSCLELGFNRFIIADPALLVALWKAGLSPKCRIHISGELGEINAGVIDFCRELGADRIIFHRKVSLKNMELCIAEDRKNHPDQPLEYEAFMLNEMCHFHGGFCNSLHCDELTHMCRVPYRLGKYRGGKTDSVFMMDPERENLSEYVRKDPSEKMIDGCGLCALAKLKKIGVTNLKVVGRGNYSDCMVRDIRLLKRACSLLKQTKEPDSFAKQVRENLFPDGCSGACYCK